MSGAARRAGETGGRVLDHAVYDRLLARIHSGKRFVISSHVRLDGDGLASALAVDSLLRRLGKKTHLLMPGTVPQVFRFLPGAERVVNLEDTPDAKLPADVDTFIVVDVADAHRLGGVAEKLPKGVFVVSIDHHRTGTLHADIDCDDATASATGELVYRLVKRGKLVITPDVATNLYAAILSDTHGFSLPNTNPECLRIAAEMVELGAGPGYLGDRIYRSWQPGQLALWSEVAGRVKTDCEGKLAWTSMTCDMLERHQVHADDTQDFADIPRMLVGVEVGALFREFERGVRVSLRSNHIPILAVAEKFDGGGHDLACGCELETDLADAETQVLAALRELLAGAGKK